LQKGAAAFDMPNAAIQRQYRHIHASVRQSSKGSTTVSWYIKLTPNYAEVLQHIPVLTFPSEEAALKALLAAFRAAGLRNTASTLRLQQSSAPSPAKKTLFSKYVGVVRTNSGRYRVQTKFGAAHFPTESEAIQAWREENGKVKPQAKKVPLSSFVPFLHEFFAIYKDIGWLIPGDVEAACSMAITAREMFQEPMFKTLCILGKYKPWCQAVQQAWLDLQSERPGKFSSRLRKKTVPNHQARIAFILKVVREALLKCDGDRMEEWVANCGRNVSHHSGYLAVVQKFGFLKCHSCNKLVWAVSKCIFCHCIH
jgi:hypothetical protein